MLIELEEDKNLQEGTIDYTKLMTLEQRARGEYYSTQYWTRRGEVDAKYREEWEYLHRLYECKRDSASDDPDYPCSFIPLILPTVEGQVASMIESDIDFRHISNNPAQQSFMPKYDAASEYYRKKSKFKPHFKDFARLYDLIGNAYVTMSWQEVKTSGNKPKGFPRLEVVHPLSILVDGSIKDPKDLQYARYIIREVGFMPIRWAKKEYGEEYGNAVLAGFNRDEGEDPDISNDDSLTFMLLHVWTRENEYDNLQLIEMDANGLILRESDPSEPYYKFVDNEYPFGIATMIPQLGCFYGVGDGNILKYMQETVNNLTDEFEIACRFSAQARTFVDPNAKMGISQITSNPSDIIICKDPRNNVLIQPPVGISSVVPQMIQYLLQMAQQATRFHDIMTGNQQGSSATATQINTQISQGHVGIKDKKTDIADVMAWADMYCLKMCIEKWDKPFWASIGENRSEYIDAEMMNPLPTAIPTTSSTLDAVLEDIRQDVEPAIPDYFETATDNGSPILTDVDFETKVIIGESIPKGRTDMYNIMLGLAQIQVLNEDGIPEPLISPDRLRQVMEDILGMKLKTEAEEMEGIKTNYNMGTLGQLNPVGQGNVVQAPTTTPENLQSTVPQMPNADSRRVVI